MVGEDDAPLAEIVKIRHQLGADVVGSQAVYDDEHLRQRSVSWSLAARSNREK